MPAPWKNTLPECDFKWVSKALFRHDDKGKLDLNWPISLWYHPPQPANICNLPPSPDRYFAHRLFLWMPYRMWQVSINNKWLPQSVVTKLDRYVCPLAYIGNIGWVVFYLDGTNKSHHSHLEVLLCVVNLVMLFRSSSIFACR